MVYKKGIIHLTGEPDCGKTLAALTAYHPSQIVYFFDDVKKPPIEEKEFSQFVDLVSKYGNLKMLEFYQAVKKEIDALKKTECIVFDTWSRFGKAIRYYAKANPLEFREAQTFSKKGDIRGMEEWSETHRVEADMISFLSQKCETLFLITHIKEQRIAGAKTGSYEPDCGKSFNRVCNMRLWLRHNLHSGVPISLVLKRISKVEVSKDGVKPINVLPRKVTPGPADNTIWDGIARYWDIPVGNNEPQEYEIPSPFELSILDGILTDDQKEMWQAELRANQQREAELQELFNAQYTEAKALVNELAAQHNGLPKAAIANLIKDKVQEKYPDYDSSDIVEMIE